MSISVIPRTSSGTASGHCADRLPDQAHRVVGMQGGSEQPGKCKGIAIHVQWLFEVDVTGQGLDVHHGRVSWLWKVQDDERARGSGVCACTEGHDLQCR